MSPSETDELVGALDETEREDFFYDWYGEAQWFTGWAREKQRPPDGDWFIWLILAGRGFGKTRAGAEWVIRRAKQGMGPIALVGETAADVRDTMVELGDSSILKVSPPSFKPKYEPSKRRLTWPNGVTATTFSGDKPDQLRGPQHATVWADEPAKWKYPVEAWDNLEFGLRLSSDPRCVATTTPRPIGLIEDLVDDEDVATTRGTTYENIAHLSERFRKRLLSKYEGTRLGRQELHAEILSDNPGALWSHDDIEHTGEHPSLRRVVVGVDPSGGGNDIGIVTAGVGPNGFGYVLSDDTLNASPMGWARQAKTAYDTHSADRIVAERNFGGDMVKSTIQSVDESLPVSVVTASRGKQQRAEPVASLYEQDRVMHVGTHPELEDEMTTWDPDESDWSPNRVDALVWALTELMLADRQPGVIGV